MIPYSINLYIDLVEKVFKLIENNKKKAKILKCPLGETLQKLQMAQEHLTDALEAVDVIKDQAILEKVLLDKLLKEVEEKRKLYNATSHDLEIAQSFLNQDHIKLREALGVNSSREKIIGFISGVLASITATALGFLVKWLFDY